MLPDQQFDGYPSANPMPPWTPQVWRDGPDKLVQEAQAALWQDRMTIEHDALESDDRAMAGGTGANQNESDQVIDTLTPGDGPSGVAAATRAEQWRIEVMQLYATEPRLAGWSSGDKTGNVNPAP